MSDALTYAIEIAVGLACVIGAVSAWRRARWLGAGLAVAGAAAVVHGAFSLAG